MGDRKCFVNATFGNVEDEVCHLAKKMSADLIVMGVNGDLPFWPLSNSIAYKVIATAECPVLTLPHASHRDADYQAQLNLASVGV